MPLNTVNTPSGVPAKRNAQEATLSSGRRRLNSAITWSLTDARRPPSNGSIITAGMPLR